MHRRTRLRHRLYVMTALNAAILIGLTILLTWRARESHREVRELLSIEGRAVTELQQVQRNHSAFMIQWNEAMTRAPELLPKIVGRYRSVTQLLDSAVLEIPVTERLRSEVRVFNKRLNDVAIIGTTSPPADRLELMRDFTADGDRLRGEMERIVLMIQQEIDRRLPDIELAARHTMWVALGIVYIIAIFSFAVAKLSLEKVVSPIEHLVHATDAVSSGELSKRVTVSGDHEVAELTKAFNAMTQRLEEMTEALRHQASTDELTALPNFRSFQSVIDAEVERASRYEQAFGILVFDIDHFKRYNDSFGHLAGNEALQQVAMIIRSTLRAVDTPARYGGEEFVAIVPQIDAPGLAVIAERVRKSVEMMPVIADRSSLTISVGGAIFPVDGQTRASLFVAADKRLYAAKSGGRNRVIVSEGAVASTA